MVSFKINLEVMSRVRAQRMKMNCKDGMQPQHELITLK